MSLGKEDIEHLASLSRIELDPGEAAVMETTLDSVLEYVGRLSKVDVSGVPEREGEEVGLGLRADAPRGDNEAERSVILRNFPDREGDLLKVPAVFEKPKT